MTVEERLAKLPEHERAAVEGMIAQLIFDIKGVGKHTALEIILAVMRKVREQRPTRKVMRLRVRNGRP